MSDSEEGLSSRVRRAVFWRSGSQIVAQIVMWGSTLAVIRILNPQDYGLFAMTQVVLVLFNFLNGYGFASALIQSELLEQNRIRQAFGMLILLNGGLAILQLVTATLVAAYYRQPEIASLLRVQALLYLATPFIALPDALLSRALDFRNQAKANLAAALAGALAALGCALAGLGVWTLVFAPIALFYTRAICLTLASRVLVRPSFDFRGAGAMFGFGGAIARFKPVLDDPEPGRHRHWRPNARSACARPLRRGAVPDADLRQQVRAAAQRGGLSRLFASAE